MNAPKYPRLYAAQYHVFKVVSSLLFVCTFFFQCSYFVSSVQPSIAQPTAAAILSRGNENVSYLGSRWIGWIGLFPPPPKKKHIPPFSSFHYGGLDADTHSLTSSFSHPHVHTSTRPHVHTSNVHTSTRPHVHTSTRPHVHIQVFYILFFSFICFFFATNTLHCMWVCV